MKNLPNELIYSIIKFNDENTIEKLSIINDRFYNICNDYSVWNTFILEYLEKKNFNKLSKSITLTTPNSLFEILNLKKIYTILKLFDNVDENNIFEINYIVYLATINNDYDLINYIIDKQYNILNCILIQTIINNTNLILLKYLYDRAIKFKRLSSIHINSLINATILNNNLKCLQYLHENGAPWNEEVIRYASQGGHFEIVKYLHENGAPWNEWAIKNASRNGHFEIIKWLHKNGAPWDEEAITDAIGNGHF